MPSAAQTLSLDSCRAMALRNNRQLKIEQAKKDVAVNVRKAARTKYLPNVNAVGGYLWSSREVSILNNDQKEKLTNLGSNLAVGITKPITDIVSSLVQQGIVSPESAIKLSQMAGAAAGNIAQVGNHFGSEIKDAFRTDNRNMWAGSVMLTQPLYMGGAITAANKLADIQESMADITINHQVSDVLYDVDKTYWLVVSLSNKKTLAESFNKLVCKLDSDVVKMINEGVATRADGLKIAVKKNESEITLSQVNDGLALAKMLLCQQCGIPMDSEIMLADENTDHVEALDCDVNDESIHNAVDNRAEIRLLEKATEISAETTNLVRAANRPQAMLTGGYLISNPNVYDGFSKRFGGVWNVGVMVRVPIWNWFEGEYRVRAAKAGSVMAQYQLSEAKEMVELQISQCRYKLREANKRKMMAEKNTASAEENLRCAMVGFKEGVISSTDIIAAQTAWFQAHTQKIDAQIDVRMSQLSLKKALGLGY